MAATAQANIDQLGAWVSGQGAVAFRFIIAKLAALDALATEVGTQITALGVPSAGDAAAQHTAILAAVAALQAKLDLVTAIAATAT